MVLTRNGTFSMKNILRHTVHLYVSLYTKKKKGRNTINRHKQKFYMNETKKQSFLPYGNVFFDTSEHKQSKNTTMSYGRVQPNVFFLLLFLLTKSLKNMYM